MVVVAPGEPGVPVVCWASAEAQARAVKMAANINVFVFLLMTSSYVVSRSAYFDGP